MNKTKNNVVQFKKKYNLATDQFDKFIAEIAKIELYVSNDQMARLLAEMNMYIEFILMDDPEFKNKYETHKRIVEKDFFGN